MSNNASLVWFPWFQNRKYAQKCPEILALQDETQPLSRTSFEIGDSPLPVPEKAMRAYFAGRTHSDLMKEKFGETDAAAETAAKTAEP